MTANDIIRRNAECARQLLEARAEIKRLRVALQTVREENDRAKRQFTNVSNKILDDACRALEPKP